MVYLFYSTAQSCCLLHLIKQNYLQKTSLRTLIFLPAFLSITNLNLHNIFVTLKMVKKVIMNLDLWKACGPNCIPVVVLKSCDPELCYILAELFSKCLKECCFPDCWKVLSVVPVKRSEKIGCEAGRCSKTSASWGIFIVTPLLEQLPVKAKEGTSTHEVSLASLDTNPVFKCHRRRSLKVLLQNLKIS